MAQWHVAELTFDKIVAELIKWFLCLSGKGECNWDGMYGREGGTGEFLGDGKENLGQVWQHSCGFCQQTLLKGVVGFGIASLCISLNSISKLSISESFRTRSTLVGDSI